MKTKTVAYTFLLISPIVLVLALELIFAITGVGVSVDPLTTQSDFLVSNLDFHKKYYPSVNAAPSEYSQPFIALKEKEENTLRGFVIGESTPQGFPFASNYAFPKIAETAIKQFESSKNVELINVSKTAMTSWYVRDAAPKLLRYDPDFVVVYVGHNEYYGLLGEASGGNDFSKKLFLLFQESRLLQQVYNLITPAIEEDQTLMSQLYQNTLFPKDDQRDMEIANRFIDNLKTGLEPFYSRGIPVLIFSPVSNLISMPPFGPSQDPDFRRDIREITNKMITERIIDPELFNQLKMNYDYSEYPGAIWLQAVIDSQISGEVDLGNFIVAKDNDTVPFRAKSSLIRELNNWAITVPGVTLIDTAQELTTRYGPEAFSDLLFVDHVHFNLGGHKDMAGILVKHLNTALDLNLSMPGLAAYFSTWFPQKDLPQFTSFEELIVFEQLDSLFSSPPYTTSDIPYNTTHSLLIEGNAYVNHPAYSQALKGESLQDWFEALITLFRQEEDVAELVRLYSAEYYKNPGSYDAVFNMAVLFSGIEGQEEVAKAYLQLALKLSENTNRTKAAFIDQVTNGKLIEDIKELL